MFLGIETIEGETVDGVQRQAKEHLLLEPDFLLYIRLRPSGLRRSNSENGIF
jgi:hypothetical protein